MFGLRFRQNAARALMLPRMNVTQRTPLWQQRLRSRHLLALVKKQRNFPIIVETYRECLQDVLEIERVGNLLGGLSGGDGCDGGAGDGSLRRLRERCFRSFRRRICTSRMIRCWR